MCTTIGFSHKDGQVFGRTLELGVELDNKIRYVPRNYKDFVTSETQTYSSKYAILGSGFFDITSFGDGINDQGLMGSNNFFPGYASFAKEPMKGKINTTTPEAFDYLLSHCKNVQEVKEEAKKILLVEEIDGLEPSSENHFYFMDKHGDGVVVEPKNGVLEVYDNPFGVLTNSPSFPWHTTNLKNYVHLQKENIESKSFSKQTVSKLGEGTGMMGLPGDFTPPSRFVRAAYFVSETDKEMNRNAAILQGFRILSQFDIPKGAILDKDAGHQDETLYTSIMDTNKKTYSIKCKNNINIQNFSLEDFKDTTTVKMIDLEKTMVF